MAYSGKYFPKNPNKYKGDVNNIIYRSLWERRVMVKLDENEDVVEWSSEELPIPYRSPLDGELHRYFVDFIFKVKSGDTKMVEVKPHKQTLLPEKPKRVTKRFIKEVATYCVNQAKWKAAKAFCEDNGWEFIIITEKELFPEQSK